MNPDFMGFGLNIHWIRLHIKVKSIYVLFWVYKPKLVSDAIYNLITLPIKP